MNGKGTGKAVKTSKKPTAAALKPLKLSEKPDGTQKLRKAMFALSKGVKPLYKNK